MPSVGAAQGGSQELGLVVRAAVLESRSVGSRAAATAVAT
jgi:hypothetical protein